MSLVEISSEGFSNSEYEERYSLRVAAIITGTLSLVALILRFLGMPLFPLPEPEIFLLYVPTIVLSIQLLYGHLKTNKSSS